MSRCAPSRCWPPRSPRATGRTCCTGPPASLRDPGGRVPANLTPEVLGIAREAFRRGIEQTVYTTYHAGQNVVQACWMRTAFALSADPAVLRQALAGRLAVAGRLRR